MKGRPPGTPKSDDPSKKKRKRSARERDLCDVKIKITEYFPGATILPDGDATFNLAQSSAYQSPQQQTFGDGLSRPVDAHLNGEKFWTIQRVNGNGGNGKGDGVAGPHKHSLEKSDEIKKSTVQRYIAAQEKEAKKIQVGYSLYHRRGYLCTRFYYIWEKICQDIIDIWVVIFTQHSGGKKSLLGYGTPIPCRRLRPFHHVTISSSTKQNLITRDPKTLTHSHRSRYQRGCLGMRLQRQRNTRKSTT